MASRLDTVAIVNDDSSVSDSLAVFLETAVSRRDPTHRPASFSAMSTAGRADCLIPHQHMPGMDGLDLLAARKVQDIQVPTILITGRLDSAISERADQPGVIAILEKPFPAAPLGDLIRGAVHGRS